MEGDLLTTTDRNGTVHTYGYDSLGRQVSDSATTLGTGINGAVRKVGTAYDGQGNAYLTTSYDVSGNVTNQVERLYNGFGQLTREYQAVSGSVNANTTPSVQYAYATSGNTDRLTGIVYPDEHTLNYNYASGVDAATSRLSNVIDGTGTLEAYTYMGLATVVERIHPLANAKLGYVTVGSTGDAGDEVTGLDRFGRVVEQKWTNTTSNATLSDYLYGYDRGGNVLFKQDAVNGNFSQLYAYDNLNQLASYQEGTLNANRTALVGNSTANQTWGYDALGNWQSVTTNGTTQTRTANAQNEYTAVGSASPAYDAAGDMITDETGKQFAYDAWGRLVAVKNSGNATLETNTYDGLGRRITTTAGGTTTTLAYSSQWQVLEESVGGNFTRRYVWSPVYVDALLFRDTDTSGTGLTAAGGNFTRLWPMQDANWNVTGVVDGTGAVNERYDYTPFGVVTVLTATYASRTASLYVWTVGFQGMAYDSVSGLSDQRMRWYSASLGRWVTSDPVGFAAGDVNLYRWVGNGPLDGLDPSGLEKERSYSKDPPSPNRGAAFGKFDTLAGDTLSRTLPGLSPEQVNFGNDGPPHKYLDSAGQKKFPGLTSDNYRVLEKPSEKYNCFALAKGDRTEQFLGGDGELYTVEQMKKKFEEVGYELSPNQNPNVEKGAYKSAFYVREGFVFHAAVQYGNGQWESKLGYRGPSILHNLSDIEGPMYGKVTFYMQKKR